MNKKILAVLVFAVILLVFAYLFSFGLLPNQGSRHKSGTVIPFTSTQTVPINNTPISFATYHNADIVQDYYTFKIPQNWKITTGTEQGSYLATFDMGTASIGTHDVPDNSTLELFILSQDEPPLKNTLANYKRIDYQKETLNGVDTYQVTYQYTSNQKQYKATRTYFAGPDKAGLLIFTTEAQNFSSLQPIFSTVLNSFQWENK